MDDKPKKTTLDDLLKEFVERFVKHNKDMEAFEGEELHNLKRYTQLYMYNGCHYTSFASQVFLYRYDAISTLEELLLLIGVLYHVPVDAHKALCLEQPFYLFSASDPQDVGEYYHLADTVGFEIWKNNPSLPEFPTRTKTTDPADGLEAIRRWCVTCERAATETQDATVGDSQNRQDDEAVKATETLRPAQEKAYQSYQMAVARNPSLSSSTDDRVYEWLEENGEVDYDMPMCETWKRHLRVARKAKNAQKNTSRTGRSLGSIRTQKEVNLNTISNQYDTENSAQSD